MIKMQLDKDSLERLIGGNAEFEVEIRNSIVHNFMKKHIKTVCNEESYKMLLNDVKKEARTYIQNELFKNVKSGLRGTISSVELGDEYKKALDVLITKEFEYRMNSKVKELVNAKMGSLQKMIDDSIDKYADNMIKDKVKNKVNKIIEELGE